MNIVWNTESDWDSYQSQSHVTHDGYGDTQGGRLQLGNDPDHPNLTGFWPLDESSGNAIDYSGNGNDATVNSATQDVTGTFGTTCYQFDGVDDYIMSDPTIPNDGDFTVMMLVNADSTPDGNDRIIGSWRGSDNTGDVYFYSTTTFGGANNQMRFWTDEQGQVLIGNDIRGIGWVHIGLTRNGDNYTLYQDGSVVSSGSQTGALIESVPTLSYQRFGSGRDERYHSGKLDTIVTLDTALSQSEIQKYAGLTGNYVSGVKTA